MYSIDVTNYHNLKKNILEHRNLKIQYVSFGEMH